MKRKTDNFNKFYNKKRNSAVKEEFRQEKKAAKKERKESIERRFEEKRQAKALQQPPAGRQGSSHSAGRHGHAGTGHAGSPKRNSGASTFKGSAPRNTQPAAPDTHTQQDQELRGDLIPLNKYIAHGGICSRRDAAELIRLGKVQVNGQAVTEPGTKVAPSDLVKVNGKKVTISRNFVYILLNKPKDYITTTDDPLGRKTVLDLIRHATEERVFPVGRLDRNTSGVLLLTNDGDLSQKLAHPSHEIKKIYHVVLDKPLTKGDFDKIIGGEVHLEDGVANVDAMAYEDVKDKTQIGLEIHSGRNRIVRRIFEHLGYDVRGLDRVMYAGLTKKNVQRGKWRLLSEKEVRILKYLNSSIKGSAARAKDWDANQEEISGATGGSGGTSRSGARSARSGKPATKAAKPGSIAPPPGNQLIDPEGLLSESEASHFSKKKRGFSPYTKRPATGKRSHSADRPGKPGPGGKSGPATGGKRPHATTDKRPHPATDKRPHSATDKRPYATTDRPGKPGPATGGKRRPNAAPGARRPGGAPRSNRKEK